MNDSTLRAYLLGQLPADDAARLEEQVLQDEEAFELLRSIEDDLFDEHARNGLSISSRNPIIKHSRVIPSGMLKKWCAATFLWAESLAKRLDVVVHHREIIRRLWDFSDILA